MASEGVGQGSSEPMADNSTASGTSRADLKALPGKGEIRKTVSPGKVYPNSGDGKDTKPAFAWGKLNTNTLLPRQNQSSLRDDGDEESGKGPEATKDGLQPSRTRKSTLVLPGTPLGDPDGDKVPDGPRRDSTFVSMESLSRHSVEYRVPTPTVLPVNNEEEKPKSVVYSDDALIRLAIPYLPVGLAVTCLISNILLPGSGE